MFEDCGNCFAMEQSDYTSERQNLLLTLTSLLYEKRSLHDYGLYFCKRNFEKIPFI